VRFELRNKVEDYSDESTESDEEVEQSTLIVRRYERVRKLVKRYNPPYFHFAFVLIATNEEPKLVKEAVDSTKGRLWKESMVKEMESLHKNETWDLFELPDGRNIVGSKCVFNKKMNLVGQVEKFKARLVAKGCSQVGVEFSEIFFPVVKLTSIRVLLSLATTFDLEIKQMIVKTTFLHGHLKEEIYMKPLEGFVVKGKKNLVCKLKISLYGLKKSPRMWYQKSETYILSFRFVRSKAKHCICSKEEGGCFIYVALYVDDMLLVENNMDAIKEVKKQLSSKFETKDLDASNFILGMEIKRDQTTRKLGLNQKKYIETILKHFNM
jgi:hypothetical protein